MVGRRIRSAVLFLVCFQAAACQFLSGHSESERKDSNPSTTLFSIVSDKDWELRLLNEIPKEGAPDHIRCIPSGHCWLWNVKSIWLADNANRWRQVYTLPPAQRKELDAIESVSMISPQTGWFNTYQAIYQTRDGGVSWNPISGPVLNKNGSGFRGIAFRDEMHGWLAGAEFRQRLTGEPVVNNAVSEDGKDISIAAIWQTTDGGSTWQPEELKRLIGRFTYIEFLDHMGVAIGDAGCLFTNDAGKTWRNIGQMVPRQGETEDRPTVTGATFLNHDNGWILTSWFDILSTHDGGKTWSRFTGKAIGPNKDSEGLVPSGVVLADKLEGLLIAGPSGTGGVFKTKDGGKTWTQISANDHFYDVGLIGGKGFLLGDKGIYSISLKQDNH